jgi:cytochrome P450
MIKTDEWTERKTSTQRQLMRARVRRASLEEYYQRLVAARAESNGPDAAELLVSGEAAEEMSALEEELDDARHDLEAADARQKLLTELLSKKPPAEEGTE